MSSRETFVIVGASLAGARAAQTLRLEGFDGEVLLVGAERHPPYERPMVSKEALGGDFAVEQAYLQPVGAWSEQEVELLLSTQVTGIDRSSRRVELSDGRSVAADKVLLCTGGRPRRLPVDGAELEGVLYLREMDDALVLSDRLTAGARVVIVGGGFIGAEVAARAAEAGCDVTLIEAEDVPLWRVLGQELGARIARLHRSNGVRVATRTTVSRISGGPAVTHVVTSDDEWIPADVVVVGVGIVPATDLAASAGLAIGNGILIDGFCQSSVDGVYAAGDVANQLNPIFGERMRVEHWKNAQEQGAAAARAMLGRGTEFRHIPWFWSDQYDCRLQMTGHPSPSDSVVYRGDPESTSFTAFFTRNAVLKAAFCINRPRDVRQAMSVIESGRPVDVGQLTDADASIRS